MLKKIRISSSLFLVVLFMLGFYFTGYAAGIKTETQEITVKGKLSLEAFVDANNKPEKAYILYLDRPINVEEDSFAGPTFDVKKLELVLLNKENIHKAKDFINKRIKVVGTLFYGFSAHHHTDVLITVKTIDKED